MSKKSIFVTGDIANDYFLVRGKRFYSDDNDKNLKGTHYTHHKGGAYLIFEFLKEISLLKQSEPKNEQLGVEFGFTEGVFDILPDKNKSYVSVLQYEKENEKTRDKEKFWRINEFLGYGDYGTDITDFSKNQVETEAETDIFILDDAGMDFADVKNRQVWTSLIETISSTTKTKPDTFVLYKKSGEFKNNGLFNELLTACEKKQLNLLTILSVQDIRRLDVKVSSGLSWEQSALDLVSELTTNEILGSLMKSKYLVITFKSSGALFVVNNGNQNFEYTLIFDPDKMEGEDEEKDYGKTIGRMSFFTAALASQINLAKKDKHYKIDNAIKAGLTTIRNFYKVGYIETSDGIRYPFKEAAELLNKTKEFTFSSASVPKPETLVNGQGREWSILIDNYSEKPKKEGIEIKALTALAKNIVLKGSGILNNIPSGRFGKLFTIDRSEIESLRNLKKIMESYLNFDEGKKPLSIAVFGPPGAGKSFAVEEIGQGIMGTKYHILTFNLSQFNDTGDLIGALHQVRDCVLRKKTPIVFWDEFDSQGFKWLQYLLAPMQDGVFQEGQLTHPVGKCIFVFAGGTSYNMGSFGKFNLPEAEKDFILKKGPDFISRLNGYINILGPNKRQLLNPGYEKEEDKWVDDPTDVTYPVRRAIFITSLLRLKKSDYPYQMDGGLLNALIKVDRYKHGSRSLSNLLGDIRQNNPRKMIQRSWLPSKTTLELYFKDPDKFYTAMENETDFLEMAWEIAPLIHSYWMEKINDPTNEYSVEYGYLPVFIKESNVQAARRIPEVLAAGGFKLTKKNDHEKLSLHDYQSLIDKNDHELHETMARKEHELWWEFYKENGWEQAAVRNDYEKKHNCMVPFNDLSKTDQDKDRKIVSEYPGITEKAGFGIVKL